MHFSTVTRLFTDADGETHFEDIQVPLRDAGDIGEISDTVEATGLQFRRTDGDYDFQWHNAPSRRYLVTLDGEVDITVSDGTTRRFGTGDVVLLEDTTGKGHLSRAVAGRPRRSIFVLLD